MVDQPLRTPGVLTNTLSKTLDAAVLEFCELYVFHTREASKYPTSTYAAAHRQLARLARLGLAVALINETPLDLLQPGEADPRD